MIITVCGSVSFLDEMRKMRKKLLAFEVNTVHLPLGFRGNDREIKDAMTQEEDAERKIKYDLIKRYYKKIIASDAIIVANYSKNEIENYIGGNTLLEMGFAFVNKKPIFLQNPIPSQPYTPEIRAMKPIVLNGNIEKMFDYLNKNRYRDLYNLY